MRWGMQGVLVERPVVAMVLVGVELLGGCVSGGDVVDEVTWVLEVVEVVVWMV